MGKMIDYPRHLLRGLSTLGIAALALVASFGMAIAETPQAASPNTEAQTAEMPTADTSAEGPAPETPAVDSPVPQIERFHEGLLGIMKEADSLGFDGRIGRLEPLMGEVFDLDFMASKTVGSHWRKLTDADKERWTHAFARLTTANYAGRFTGYTGEEFELVGVEEAARDTKLVLTKIVIPKEDDVEINYRLMKRDGEWRVIDVYLDGTVSELALRRSEYSSALKREGFDELVGSVETKIADLKAKGLAGG